MPLDQNSKKQRVQQSTVGRGGFKRNGDCLGKEPRKNQGNFYIYFHFPKTVCFLCNFISVVHSILFADPKGDGIWDFKKARSGRYVISKSKCGDMCKGEWCILTNRQEEEPSEYNFFLLSSPFSNFFAWGTSAVIL